MSKSRQTAPLANPVTAARESHTPEANRANARLIAAAPDLLAALERLEHSYMLLSTGKPVRDMAETLGEVHHALKKARGE